MINPNKYVRGAWVSALRTATGLNAWDKNVPKSVNPIPERYILVANQRKNRFAVAKDCYEWLGIITLEIISIQPQGFASTAVIDDIEEAVITTISNGIEVPGFTVKFTRLLDQNDMDVETDTESIGRRILIYEQWLDRPITT